MAFYTYKNCEVKLNEQNLLVKDCSINYRSTNEPRYLANQRHSFEYSPETHIGGALRLNYLLTGVDPLKEFLTDESGRIAGNFGGLYFESGYLSSYRFSAQSAAPVEIETEIMFFDELKGDFTPVNKEASDAAFLNFSDATISYESGIGDLNNVLQVNYEFTSAVQPVILAGETRPNQVSFGKKMVNLGVDIDTLSGDLSIYGNKAELSIGLRKPGGSHLIDSYSVQGILHQKAVSVSANEPLRTNLAIKQNFVSNPPAIHDFGVHWGGDQHSFYQGDQIFISGERLDELIQVCFGDTCVQFPSSPDSYLSHANPTQYAYVSVPWGASVKDPYISVHGVGGTRRAEEPYTIRFRPMTIHDIQPRGEVGPSGRHGETIVTIRGQNFDRLTSISFGEGHYSTDFTVIEEGAKTNNMLLPLGGPGSFMPSFYAETALLTTEVPEMANKGFITLYSEEKNEHKTHSEYEGGRAFIPWPKIEGLTPDYGSSGDVIAITGSSFTEATGVIFSHEKGNSYAAFSIESSSGILATVPSGLVAGTVAVWLKTEQYSRIYAGTTSWQGPIEDTYQIYGESPMEFTQPVMVTGFQQFVWSYRTWLTLGDPWAQLKTACKDALNGTPSTVEISYSFAEDDVFINYGATAPNSYYLGYDLLNAGNYTTETQAYGGGTLVHDFTGEVGESFNEWKGVFEHSFPGLTLNFKNKGAEDNMTYGTSALYPTTVAMDIDAYWQPFIAGNVNGQYYGLATHGQPPSSNIYHNNIGDIRIVGSHIDARNGIIAFCFEPHKSIGIHGNIGGDMFWDVAEHWRLDADNGGSLGREHVSIKQVVTHELGHAFGIEHDINPDSMMHGTYKGHNTLFSTLYPNGLSGDAQTVEAIKSIYGEGILDGPHDVTGGICLTPILIKGMNFEPELIQGCWWIIPDGANYESKDVFYTFWGAEAPPYTDECFRIIDSNTLSGFIPEFAVKGSVHVAKRGGVGELFPSGKDFDPISVLGVISSIGTLGGSNIVLPGTG